MRILHNTPDPEAIVVVHGPCADGYGSAWVFHLIHPNLSARYIWMDYTEFDKLDLQQMKGKDVYVLDFSFPLPVLEAACALAKHVTVLDHHKTFMEVAIKQGWATEGEMHWRREIGNLTIVFNNNQCGTEITREFFGGKPDTPLVDYIGDRDLWKWKLTWSKEISAALSVLERNFEVWDAFNAFLVAKPMEAVSRGSMVLLTENHAIERILENTFWITICGHKVPCVNSPIHQSELGNLLVTRHPDAPFAAVYYDKDGVRAFSLRGRGTDDFDVSAIAKQFGGGGHKKAAGFGHGIGRAEISGNHGVEEAKA